MAFQIFTFPHAAVYLLFSVLFYVHCKRTFRQPLPKDLPWVGVKGDQWFATFRAHRREWKEGMQMLSEGYEKYNKQGKPFVTPNTTLEPEVLLPPSAIPWLLSQPANVLSPFPVRDEIVGLKYFLPAAICEDRQLHDSVLLGPLTRRLGDFTERVARGIEEVMPQLWGTDEREWKEVVPFENMHAIVLRMSASVIFGEELARDPKFLKALSMYALVVAICTGLARLLAPPPFRFVVSRLAGLPIRFFAWRCNSWLAPLIWKAKCRRSGCQGSECCGSEHKKPFKPGDEQSLMDYIITAALSSANSANARADNIISRLLLISFAAIHTTSFTLTWTLLHLASSPSFATLYQKLRDEASTALQSSPKGVWTRAKLADLHVTDSVLKETLRHTGFGGRGAMHAVIPKEGVVLPTGERVPQGAWIGVSVRGVHDDERFWQNGTTWDGLRFVEGNDEEIEMNNVPTKEDEGIDSRISTDTQTTLERKKRSLVTTSPTFMAFMHGRNACPGRFFAAHQMKLLLAYIVLNYDIQRREKVEMKYMTDFAIPPTKEKLLVRRRPVG
ncbi:cytochrome P450 [Rhizodiscina lignyota]|uniref:Cytochrome P450 n=1 Tax=Rhizodiscina lignyota TaxID=1504668 RepID=A0A9P4ILM9_9PEZI|nr:cytochrome P450 [Rhizodiscina lignyota]